jgi:YozE SAM-like fold/Glyoxalase superfamily protein
MNNQQNTLGYLKRLAKKLKKEHNVSHSKALDFVAKENGYTNWQHCQRAINNKPVLAVKPVKEESQLSFTDWLKKHKNRNSPLGDLATDVISDKEWPSYNTLREYETYLNFRLADWAAIEALKRAWRSYKVYLRRSALPPEKRPKAKKQTDKSHDLRKIVYVSNVTSLPFPKRTVEKFNLGDAAWISWDGRKAIPVTITKVDEHQYTFRVERPLKKAGNKHFLYLDEVRSTPELACINHVTW